MAKDLAKIEPGVTHVQCPLCQKWFSQLPVHLSRAHDIKDPTAWGLEHDVKLFSDNRRAGRLSDPTKTIKFSYGSPLKYLKSAQRVFDLSIESLARGEVAPDQEIALTRAVIHAILRQIEDKYLKTEIFDRLKDGWRSVLSVLCNNTEEFPDLDSAESLLELHLVVLRTLSPGSLEDVDISDVGDLATAASKTKLLDWLSALSRLEETKVRIDEKLELAEVRRFGQSVILATVTVIDREISACPGCGMDLVRVRQDIYRELKRVSLQNNLPT